MEAKFQSESNSSRFGIRLQTVPVYLAATLLIGLQWLTAQWSLQFENPTIDEVLHLPAGISYWETGRFRLYHHNPPLVKILAAWPILNHMQEAKQDRIYHSSYWTDDPPNKAGFGHDFTQLYANDYFEIFQTSRRVMPVFLALGALFVFLWSKKIYGNLGGLLSLTVWCLCPNLLAHGRLITTDVASASIGMASTFLFVNYLRKPCFRNACFAGIALGVSLLTKFSLLVLILLWPMIWMFRLWLQPDGKPLKHAIIQAGRHALAVMVFSLLVVNSGYLFEGTGKPLGSFEFYSQTLTRELPQNRLRFHSTGNSLLDLLGSHRVNRFKGTLIGSLPCPLPAEFMKGFDDQKIDAEGVPSHYLRPDDPTAVGQVEGYPVYLNGQIRGSGWWYYYPYAFLIKTPPGFLTLIAGSFFVLIFHRKTKSEWFEESALMIVPAFMVLAMTFLTDINIGLRYILPALPYLYIGCGRLAPLLTGSSLKLQRIYLLTILLTLCGSAVSTASVAPHFLAYFNAIGGGPDQGHEHLIDSNLDWGQDLVLLRKWVEENAKEEAIGIAYFGQINPDIFRLRNQTMDWYLPPARPEKVLPLPPGRASGSVRAGYYAISASLVHGLPWRVYDVSRWAPYDAKQGAFDYFLKTEPIAKLGWSIFIYKLDEPTAARLEAERIQPSGPIK